MPLADWVGEVGCTLGTNPVEIRSRCVIPGREIRRIWRTTAEPEPESRIAGLAAMEAMELDPCIVVHALGQDSSWGRLSGAARLMWLASIGRRGRVGGASVGNGYLPKNRAKPLYLDSSR